MLCMDSWPTEPGNPLFQMLGSATTPSCSWPPFQNNWSLANELLGARTNRNKAHRKGWNPLKLSLLIPRRALHHRRIIAVLFKTGILPENHLKCCGFCVASLFYSCEATIPYTKTTLSEAYMHGCVERTFQELRARPVRNTFLAPKVSFVPMHGQ